MAENTYQLDIVTPARTIYSNRVVSLTVMAWDGYLGVLANHAPLLEQLGIGELRITEPGGNKVIYAISGGFMEVGKDRTVILADAAELPTEIDLRRAREARERAQSRLTNRLEATDLDVARAELSLQRSLNRIRLAETMVPGGR